jgi:hypothetical protein
VTHAPDDDRSVTSGIRVDVEFVRALRQLDRRMNLSYAELWRRLAPVAADLGAPRPCYATVRDIVQMLREFERRRRPLRDDVVVKLLTGRIPSADQLIDLVEMNTTPTWRERPPPERDTQWQARDEQRHKRNETNPSLK